jgi:hypothetical protein
VRRWIDSVAVVIAGVGLAWVLNELGWDGMRQAVVGTGAWFAVIAAVDVAAIGCDAFAIHGLLRARDGEPARAISYAAVFVADISGVAVNRLTPGNTLGEALKATMLSRRVGTSAAVSAIVLFDLITMFVGMATVAIGVAATAVLVGLPVGLEAVVGVGCAALVGIAVVVLAMVRRGALGTLVDAARRVRVISATRHAKWKAAVADIDAGVRAAGGLGRGVVGVLGARLLHTAGTVLVLHACGVAMTPALVVAAVSVGAVVTSMSNVVPLGLGLSDGANYVLYDLLGATAQAGLLVAMVNRLRTCALAAVGLVVLAIASARRGSVRA